MKNIILSIFSCFLSLPLLGQGLTGPTPQVLKDTLRAIYIIDEADVRLNAKHDLDYLSYTLRDIAYIAKLGYSETIIRADTVSEQDFVAVCTEVKNKLRGNDALVVYASTHGSNDGSSKWPLLRMGFSRQRYAVASEQFIGFFTEPKNGQTGRDFKGRLMLLMMDACNNTETAPPQRTNLLTAVSHKSGGASPNAVDLFANEKGIVVLSSSQPGEKSFTDEKVGSYLTHNFRFVANTFAGNSWSEFLERVKEETIIYCNTMSTALPEKLEQTPQYEAIIEGEGHISSEKPKKVATTVAERAYRKFAGQKVYTLTRRIKTVSDPQTPYSTAKNIFGTIQNELFDNKNTTIGVSSIKNPRGSMQALDKYLKKLRGLYEGKNAKYDEIFLDAVISDVAPLREVQQGALWKGEVTFKQTFVGRRNHAIQYADVTYKTAEVFIRFENGQPVVYLGKIPVKNTEPYKGK